MSKNEEFDFGRVPAVLYHGAWSGHRNSIESKGLLGGHLTDNPDLAAEYASSDIYEVKKHPNIVSAETRDSDDYNSIHGIGPGGWSASEGVYWANGVPSSYIKRVGHVISHHLKDYVKKNGALTQIVDEIHWHKKEDCPLDYDNTHEDPNQFGIKDFKNLRPHPTKPGLLVSDTGENPFK